MHRYRAPREQFATLTPSPLGINAVINPPEQIVDFACACLCARIIERDCPAETDLWMFQPCSRSFGIAEHLRRVSKQPRETYNLVRFVRREAPRGFAPL